MLHTNTPNPVDQYERKKAQFCYNSGIAETNPNLDGVQKELLYQHQELCANIQDVQQLMKSNKLSDQKGHIIASCPPVMSTDFKSTSKLRRDQYPRCLACKLATTNASFSNVMTQKPVASNERVLSRDKYQSGGSISTDKVYGQDFRTVDQGL